MPRQLTKPNQQANTFLSPNQQDLLLAALNSQASTTQPPADGSVSIKQFETFTAPKPDTMSGVNEELFMSPKDAALDNFRLDYTPDLDYIDGGDNFDFEDADLGGEMIGALPGSGPDNTNGNEKRKSPDENGDAAEGDAKRQDTQDGEKGAKKPGRKPLTSEPTTKRKAQNRAAQRAFRERREKHLKDLETKVADLTKTREADKHENGLLKEQVERLEIELREYRKRLSLNSSASRSSPPLYATGAQHRSNSGSGGFQFDFPKFGGLPGSHLFGNQSPSNGNSINKRDSNTPPATTQSPINMNGFGHASQQNSQGRSMSPQSIQGNGSNAGSPAQIANLGSTITTYSTNNNMHGFASTLPQMGNNPFGDLFSPNLLKSANVSEYFGNSQIPGATKYTADNGGDSTAGLNRVFQFNGGSISDTTSPSASSGSQWNANGNSSCGTSPEPSHDSPALKDNKEKQVDSFKSEGQQPQNTSQDVNSQSTMNTMFGFGNNDFNTAPANSFDPVLFGDYRDTNSAIVGGDFSGGFFDDALNSAPFDYGSPSNLFGILQSPQQSNKTLTANNGAANAPTPSRNLMAEIEKTRDGGDDDYGLPTTQPAVSDAAAKYISCNSIWTQLQSNPDFQDGKFDLDNLCTELRVKAKCSESGMVVNQDHVHAAIKRLGQKNGKAMDVPPLMFEQESWDNVLKKLQKGGQSQ